MLTRLDIRRLDPHHDGQMRRFFEIAWRAEKEDGRPWNSYYTYPEMSGYLREPTDDRVLEGLRVYDDGEMVGAGVLEVSLLDNLDKAYVFPFVEPERRGRGVGGALLESLVEGAAEQRREQVIGFGAIAFEDRDTSGVLRFAADHGFELASTEIFRTLRLPVPSGLLEGLAEETTPFHQGYSIETFVDTMPERYLESYCALLNQLIVDAPSGSVDFEAQNVTPVLQQQKLERNARMGRRTYLAVAVRDGEAVAQSDLVVPPGGTGEAHQMGTFVHREHRGHRLGTAVKVANLAVLQRAHPEVTAVHTQNDETNSWMVAINERLGFEPVGVCPAFVRSL
jgi:GNAT superfamily N-acetyltransferase